MSSVSLTGADTISVAGRNLADLADGDAVNLTFPDDIAMVKASKNGNAIYAANNQGLVAECSIRVLLGSSDDKFLNSLLQLQKNDFSAFTLMAASFSKRVGDGQSNMSTVVYQLAGGVFKKQQDAKTSAEGDTEQSVSVFLIRFGSGSKSVQ